MNRRFFNSFLNRFNLHLSFKKDPGLIHICESWADRAALDRHFATDHIAQWRAAWPELGIGERNLALYEVGEGTRL